MAGVCACRGWVFKGGKFGACMAMWPKPIEAELLDCLQTPLLRCLLAVPDCMLIAGCEVLHLRTSKCLHSTEFQQTAHRCKAS